MPEIEKKQKAWQIVDHWNLNYDLYEEGVEAIRRRLARSTYLLKSLRINTYHPHHGRWGLYHADDVATLGELPFSEVNFPHLEELQIVKLGLTDIDKLRSFPSLKHLIVPYNAIKDMSVLSHMTQLEVLDIRGNPVQDLSPLKSLVHLRELHLSLTEDIDPNTFFSDFPQLKKLRFSTNSQTHLVLDNLHQIEELQVYGERLKPITIKALPNLQNLQIQYSDGAQLEAMYLPKLKKLHIDSNLDSLSLTDLPALTSLQLSYKKLNKLNIFYLTGLRDVSIYHVPLKDIDFRGVPHLERIKINETSLESLVFHEALNHCEELELQHNKISNIERIDHLPNLRKLQVRNNQLRDLPGLQALRKLEEIDLSKNPYRDFLGLRNKPLLRILFLNESFDVEDVLFHSKYLEELYISDQMWAPDQALMDSEIFPALRTIGYKPTVIKQLEERLGEQMRPTFPGSVLDFEKNYTFTINRKGEVTALRLRRTNSIRNLSFLPDFPKLKILDLRFCNIDDISPLSGLSNLEELHLYRNSIGKIPSDFFEGLPNLKYLNIRGNPIQNIPSEIFDLDKNVVDEVRTYLGSLTGTREYLHQAKMILIGNGEVGKTSIRLKLRDSNATLPDQADRTQGLDIETLVIEGVPPELTGIESNIDFKLSIWDFGGQGRYRDVQQLFCSRKALYVFVTSIDDEPTAEEYVGFEYWLSMAKAYGYDAVDNWQSPVIHVVNKCDIAQKAIDEVTVLNSFENIHQFIKISCLTLSGFESLISGITTALPKISKDVFSNQFSSKWFNVKRELEDRIHENYLERATYLELCEKHQMNKQEADLWLEYLDRIGDLIFFRDNEELNEFIVLNPLWVKRSMYDILDSNLIHEGVLRTEYLEAIWSGYNQFEREKLLALMLAYEFSYQHINLSTNAKSYLVPALFADKPAIPEHVENVFSYGLRFVYEPFLPAGTVNKLIVRLNEMIYQNLKWKNGCILHSVANGRLTYAEIEENWEQGWVDVRLGGADLEKMYSLVRKSLTTILSDLKKAKFVDQLQFAVQVGIGDHYESVKTIVNFGMEHQYGFLFGLETVRPSSKKPRPVLKRKVFVSYSTKDQPLKQQLLEGIAAHLSNLPNLEIEFWSDSNIKGGSDFEEDIEGAMRDSHAALILFSASYRSSTFITEVELPHFLKRRQQGSFVMIPVLMRYSSFSSFEPLANLNFFKTYQRDYGVSAPIGESEILPFEYLSEQDGIKDYQLNSYYQKLSEFIKTALS